MSAPARLSMAPMPCSPISRAVRWLSTTAVCGAIVLAASCSQDVTSPEETRGGAATFTGRWGGQPWEGDAGVVIRHGGEAGDTLYVYGTSPVSAGMMPLEHLYIRVVFDGVGSYNIDGDDVQLWQLVGGDGISAIYEGDGPEAGVMNITSYDEASGELEGTVSFEARSTSEYASYGPVASFENGEFRASLPATY